MCSICGIIKKTDITPSDTSKVAAMNEALIHRGPNSAGFFSAEHAALAMRRLSIIDLDGGKQPLFNEDKTISVIANGEIYNYVELREELCAKGHVFTSKSDCETIIHAYEEYGDDFVQHLRGMFAFCLHDAKKNKLLLVRDRLGEKPLYLYENEEEIAFASEMKALISFVPKETRTLSHDAVYAYFFYQYIPDPLTAIKEIRKLPPATILEINLSDFSKKERKYWSPHTVMSANGEPKKEIRGVLDDIEKIIIRSDVPVGISLSGGIDSSVIAILSARYKKDLHAFSIGYEGRPENDERMHARSLAEKLGMKFHDIELSQKEFVRDFNKVILSLDDPIADIAAYGYYRVAQKAREVNVPVLLAGFGGDEIFGGYSWAMRSIEYNTLKKHLATKCILFWKLLIANKRAIIKNPIWVATKIVRQAFGREYLCYDLTPGFNFVAENQKEIFTRSFLGNRNRSLPYSFFAHENIAEPEVTTPILLEDLWMLSNCIPLGDRLSMAHSIEMRLPLLDYILIEKVLALHKSKKVSSQTSTKQWLIDAMGADLPKEIAKRKKRGFTPPTSLWINEVIQKNRDKILNGYLVKNDILDQSFIEQALINPKKFQDFLYKILVLETWLTHYLQ